ncbi:hypothetical protein PIB30_031099 [Stylosanthes scabra]|uniref:Uncharacterized protein n=1 Tax=Stylosanthes scabra TaxID=79078 RepID=A0ABU6UC49_9FABA|nr:hypothetical protein [Stylosanthes scabra]
MAPLSHQTLPIMQQQSIPVPQQAPAPPSFRPVQPLGMQMRMERMGLGLSLENGSKDYRCPCK